MNPFSEDVLDLGVNYGAVGGPGFSTDIVVMAGGHESRNGNWELERGRWEAGGRRVTKAELDTLLAFFRARRGMLQGFRFKDWADWYAVDEPLTLDGTPSAQLVKTYGAGADAYVRPIKKPRSGATFKRNGSAYATPVVDTTTGVVTLAADATAAASSITPGATTEVVLASNPGGLLVGEKLYLSGFTGADAALVNDLAHTITAITGTGPYTFTLATDTTGKSITLGSGQGAKYPQPTETLTWSGEFDVPARFDIDRVRAEFRAYREADRQALYDLDPLPIVELRRT